MSENKSGRKGATPDQLYTTKQAAKILVVTERVMRDLCLRGLEYGGIDAFKINGKWRVTATEINKFIESRKGDR